MFFVLAKFRTAVDCINLLWGLTDCQGCGWGHPFPHQLWKFIIPPCWHQRIKTWALFIYCDSSISLSVTSRHDLVFSLLHSTSCTPYRSCACGAVTNDQPVGSMKPGLFCHEAKPYFMQTGQFIKTKSAVTTIYLSLSYIPATAVSVCNVHRSWVPSNI